MLALCLNVGYVRCSRSLKIPLLGDTILDVVKIIMKCGRTGSDGLAAIVPNLRQLDGCRDGTINFL